MGAILTSVETNNVNRIKAIQTIVNFLRIVNTQPTAEYLWVNRYSDQQLQQMLVGWQQNQPQLFATQGYYIL